MKPNWTVVSNQFSKDFSIDFSENAAMANRIDLSMLGFNSPWSSHP
jgi:hypothetical protein